MKNDNLVKKLDSELLSYRLRYSDAMKELKASDGKLERLNKNFQLTAETAKELEQYWHMVSECFEKCAIADTDSIYEAICKAYILASGRENKAFSILKEHGITIYNGSAKYNDFFLKTIYPKKNQEDIAAENIKDPGLLTVARALGMMREKEW